MQSIIDELKEWCKQIGYENRDFTCSCCTTTKASLEIIVEKLENMQIKLEMDMMHVRTERFGKFLTPKKFELELKSFNDRQLIIAYLNARNAIKLNTEDNQVDCEISNFDKQIYCLQEMEDRNLISGKENLLWLDRKLEKLVNFKQYAVEDLEKTGPEGGD